MAPQRGDWDRQEASPCLDLQKALDLVGGDTSLLRELLEIFQESTPPLLESLQTALAHGDAHRLARHAHALKGSAASVGALRLRRLAGEIEDAAQAGELEQARRPAALLAEELAGLAAAASRLVDPAPA